MKRIAIILTLLASPAYAIVDVHDEYYANPGVRFFSVVAFDFSGSSGTKDQSQFELATHIVHRREMATWLFVGSLDVEETNDTTSENSKFAHLRHTRTVSGPHGYEFLVQYSEDEFERLDERVVAGAGYRFEWQPSSDKKRGLLGTGIIRERERITQIDDVQDTWRANLFATVEKPLSSERKASFSFSAYAQPAIDDLSDLRGIGVLNFEAGLSKQIAVKFGVGYSYDSDPEPGVENANVDYSSGITLTFKPSTN